MSAVCPACGGIIPGSVPDYPTTCRKCGIKYGPGGEVETHRPDSDACRTRQLENAKAAK